MTDPSWFQITAWIAATVAATVALVQFGVKLRQDAREFRHKQAEKAIAFVEAFFHSKDCALVVEILDYENGEWKLESGDVAVINMQTLRLMLRTTDTASVSSLDKQIRSAVDSFFARLDRLHAMIEVDLVRWPDVVAVFGYVIELTRTEPQHTFLKKYVREYRFFGALALMIDTSRFPILRTAHSVVAPQ